MRLVLVLVASCLLAACSSSGGKHGPEPLCKPGAGALVRAADGGDPQINPARGLLVTIKSDAQIQARTSSGCQARLSYSMLSVQPLVALEVTGRIGPVTRPGVPALHDTPPGSTRWDGSLTLPLDAAARSVQVTVRVVRFTFVGKPPAGPPPGPASITLRLTSLS